MAAAAADLHGSNLRRHRLTRFWNVLTGPWMVVVASLYILSFAGATYIFGIYSEAIKSALGYDQETIGTLSFFKDLGANVGILSGLLTEVAPTWAVLAVGAVLNLFGYTMVWLATTKKLSPPPSRGLMYLYLCVGANSQTFANTAALVTCVKNFPHSRGVVLGLLKGCVGLSGAIFTQIYHAVYGHDAGGVILLIGVLPAAVTFLFMFLVRPMPPILDSDDNLHHQHRRRSHFFSFLYLALLLAGFLTLVIILENVFPVSALVYKAMGALTLLLVAANVLVAVQAEKERSAAAAGDAPPVPPPAPGGFRVLELGDVAPVKEQSISNLKQKHEAEGNGKVDRDIETAASIAGTATTAAAAVVPGASGRCSGRCGTVLAAARRGLLGTSWPERGEDFTIPQAILSLDMWILFVSITCGVGATLTAIDNMGQIGASLGYSTVSISTCVSLISIWNFLGRVIAGFVSEYLLRRYRVPRTLALTVVLAAACVGHLLIALPGPGTLYVASVVVGLCFGAQWPLLFAVISELFGLKYYATLYNVGAVASPLGSYLLNVRVAGYFYDKEARRQMAGGGNGEVVCVGARCFREAFLIMTMVSGAGSLISILLVMRTRKFYAQDIYAKFRSKEEVVVVGFGGGGDVKEAEGENKEEAEEKLRKEH